NGLGRLKPAPSLARASIAIAKLVVDECRLCLKRMHIATGANREAPQLRLPIRVPLSEAKSLPAVTLHLCAEVAFVLDVTKDAGHGHRRPSLLRQDATDNAGLSANTAQFRCGKFE